jgi:Subtilase family
MRLLCSIAGAAVVATVLASSVSAAPLELRARGAPPLHPSAGTLRQLAAANQELVVATTRDASAARMLRRAGAKRLSRHIGLWLVPAGSAALPALLRSGSLRYAHPDAAMSGHVLDTPLDPPTDPLGPTEWWLSTIGAAGVTAPGPGVALTTIDSGVDGTHPEFAGRPVTYLNGQILDSPHGTMVTSVAAAPVNGQGMVGVYPQATLRTVDHNNTCSGGIQALDAAIGAPRPSVLNMSWGFSGPDDCPGLYEEMIVALGLRHLPVASAGNTREQGSPPSYPGAFPHVLTAAATDQSDAVAFFSTRDGANDLAAPGVSIVAATPTSYDPSGYALVDGTSFSSPMIAAAAAWLWTLRPTLAPTQVADLLRYSARDVGPPGWDADTGYGILNIPKALNDPTPELDPQEPNDDVDQVKAGGLFRQAVPAITARGRGRASVRAWLDSYEDPTDVYRVWIPGHSVVSATLTPNDNVDLEFFRPNARTVYYRNRRAALRGSLIGGSYKKGRTADRFSVSNAARRGAFIYLEAYKAPGAYSDAAYTLNVKTSRLRR